MVQDDLTGRPSTATSAEGVPFWGDEPDAWDTAWVGGHRLPGLCRVEGSAKRRVDQKRKSGHNGVSVTYTGDDAAKFTIHVTLWTAEQLSQMADILKSLRSSANDAPGVKPSKSKFPKGVLDVRHPALALLGITAAHLVEYDAPKQDGGPASGKYVMGLRFLEHTRSPGSGKASTPVPTIQGRSGALDPFVVKKKTSPATTNGAP